MKYFKRKICRKGMALIVILMFVAVVMVVGLRFIVRGDTELACGQNMEMKANMDYMAESGLEHGRGLILNPQDVSADYWAGTPGQQIKAGSNDYYDVSVSELSECDWQITSTGYRQIDGSRASVSSLTAEMRLDPSVACWSEASVLLSPALVINGDVYCNGVITNQGSIDGDYFADSLTGNAASGSANAKNSLQLVKPTISLGLLTSHFTTQTIASSSLDNADLISPTAQVYYRNGNLTINNNISINGCLAVNGNLTVAGNSNNITAKKGTPAIFVNGDFIIQENAELNCSGLVFVNGAVELPSTSTYANVMTITGSFFTNGFNAYRRIVADSSGNGYNGTPIYGCVLVPSKDGLGSAMDLDGEDDYIQVGGLLGQPARITICAWVSLRSNDKHGSEIISLGDCVGLRVDQDEKTTNGFYYRGSSRWNVTTLNRTYKGQGWHHIAYVVGNGIQRIYVDGEALASTTYTSAISYSGQGSTTNIGCHGNGSEDFNFDGIMDEVRVYKTALSQSDILSVMAGGEPAAGDLVGYWNMECGTITINAAPVKAAIYDWPSGVKDRWSPAAGAFYKSITRNP
ncbi:MAG: hypothetical protein JW806_07990 [Sedimentisphaerales bacterium]|nr:hypothetical protein [Sedimentisphaerales bacterium]